MSRKNIDWKAVADFEADSPKGVRLTYVANMTSPGWVTAIMRVKRGSRNERIIACATSTGKLLKKLEEKLYEKFPKLNPVRHGMPHIGHA